MSDEILMTADIIDYLGKYENGVLVLLSIGYKGEFTEGTIYYSNEMKKLQEIKVDEFQNYIYVAYASTIHKSQACTFNFSYTIHEWEKLDTRLKYVALSRATNKNKINIM
jgi:ATP-dependent exoDNAse (exonuclease V) alpha subunit